MLPFLGAHRTFLKLQAWESARHGEPEIRLLPYLVDPQRIALDIGAAEGIYSLHLQQLAKRCVAFEPNPSSHAALKRALPEVECLQAAVSARDGYTVLRIPVVNGIPYGGWGTIEPNNQLAELPPHDIEEVRVRTICLDSLAGISSLIAKNLPNLLIEVGDAQRGGSFAEMRYAEFGR